MSRDTIISLAFFATMLILTIVFACVAKHNRRRNWYLVQKKYVHAFTEQLVFVVAFCVLFPCVLFVKGLSWTLSTGLAFCLLLLILPIMRNPRTEVGKDKLYVRNIWRKCKVIPYSSILRIYSASFKNNTSIIASVEGEPKPIQIAMSTYAGMPELLEILMERCSGLISWKDLPPELKKWVFENRS